MKMRNNVMRQNRDKRNSNNWGLTWKYRKWVENRGMRRWINKRNYNKKKNKKEWPFKKRRKIVEEEKKKINNYEKNKNDKWEWKSKQLGNSGFTNLKKIV